MAAFSFQVPPLHSSLSSRLQRFSPIITCQSITRPNLILQETEAESLGRRNLLAVGLNMLCLSTSATSVAADTGAPGAFDKYIKRKKLDPLDTYVPPVILTQSQFQELEAKLLSDNPDYSGLRSYLRSGPASSLRTNIRAVAQYASEDGNGKSALEAVNLCISSLEDLDVLLQQASRNNSSATIEKMKNKIITASGALTRLLSTVPPPILEKSKEIVALYEEGNGNSSSASEQVDPDVKLLESLL